MAGGRMDASNECPNCHQRALYARSGVASGGGHGPHLLPWLGRVGGLFPSARFRVVVCAECGLTRFFADEAARERLRESGHWRAL